MPPPTQIGYVFVHCGTNNASTVRHNMTVTQSAKEMEHCIETLKNERWKFNQCSFELR